MDSTQGSGKERRLLSKVQIEQIQICTLDLSEQVGVWVQSEEALGILENAG
jgi:trimethylamine:corrinoid methyltransferase-like protein